MQFSNYPKNRPKLVPSVPCNLPHSELSDPHVLLLVEVVAQVDPLNDDVVKNVLPDIPGLFYQVEVLFVRARRVEHALLLDDRVEDLDVLLESGQGLIHN